MRFIFTADLHCSRDRKEKVLKVLDTLKSLVLENCADKRLAPKLVFAGDFWDSPATVTEASGFAPVLRKMKELAGLTDIYMIYGTPGHEAAGSYVPLEVMGINVFSCADSSVISCGGKNVLLCSLPEPRKTDFKGKDAKETARGIRKYLRGAIDSFIEAKRCVRPEFTLMQYHGEVTGAVYQNGARAGEGSDSYALPVEWIKELAPDFCGCGHIHLPQELDGNIVYLGSPAPCNFGETHDGRIVIVDCEDGKCRWKSVSLGFPVNTGLEATLDGIDDIEKKDLRGKNVRLRITLDKYLRKTFDTEKLRREILDKTGAASLQLAFDYTKTAPARAAGIAEKSSAVEKFKAYADITKTKYTDTLLGKIEDIQDTMELERSYPTERLELESLDLRGAIGIKDGQGKDEMFVDFTKYRNGILALVGPTGSGKTTLIENAIPYPRMLTRQGSLKDHFFLKDSHRILVYRTDSGKRYRVTMLIDGHAKCVGTEYRVETAEPGSDEWQRLRSVGSFESYKEWVNSTFGTFDIFLRTCFSTKDRVKGFESLADAGKTEKMELFSTLAGTDYLSVFAEQARQKQKDISAECERTRSEMGSFLALKDSVDRLSEELERNRAELQEIEKETESDRNELGKYRLEQEKYIAASASLPMLMQSLQTQRELRDSLEPQLDSVKADLKAVEEILGHKDEYKAQAEWYDEHQKKRLELKEEISMTQAKLRSLRLRLADEEAERDRILAETSRTEKEKIRAEAELKGLENSVPQVDGKCPVCGAPLSEHRKEELEKERKEKLARAEEVSADIDRLGKKMEELGKKMELCGVKRTKNEIAEAECGAADAQCEIDEISAYMETVDIDKARYAADKAEGKKLELAIRRKELETRLGKVSAELEKLERNEKELPPDWSDKIKRLERGLENSMRRKAEVEASVSAAEKQLDSAERYRAKMDEAAERIGTMQRDIKEYATIEKAFGNSGIQAFELDSAAPEISDIVNSILAETYGDRFSVSFDTQRDSADGRKISDFVIRVFDSKVGREKTLDYLSTGEATLVTQALYYAFSVLRMRRTGFCFRTRFLDESDGSFDPDTRLKYIRMIEAAHRICGASLTVLITHSQEVKELVEQRIEL